MASKKSESDTPYRGDQPVAGITPSILTFDQQRLEDERKDRERLKDSGEQYTAEEISAFMTERAALRDAHISEVNELKAKYYEALEELNAKIGRGFVKAGAPESMLSNETDERGNRRYSVPAVA